mmetsp:Transcript_130871/g.298043  ORF Transcript_130871/g.298043 Transcript_130871/m.298043 type:complete len:951 (+) Transcript_130871:94-2946(+)
MYWFQMILSRDGHIRVATLQNHMLQHNDFTKAFLPELHLPEWQRMSLVKRLLRLALYLLCVLHFGLVTSTSGYVGLVADVSMDVSLDVHHARRDCMRRCQEAGFPSVLCVDTPGLTVTRHHNSYSSIYEFSRPPDYQTDYVKAGFDACLEMALEPLGGIGGRWIEGENRAMRDAVCFSSCWRPEEPLVADEPDGRPPCLCTHRDVKMCSLPQETPGQACREDSGCWFNGTKCLSRAGYEATPCEEEPCSSWMDSAEPQRQELLTACQQKVGEFSAALSNPASATSSTTAVPLARQLAIVLGIPQATNTTTTTTTTLPPSPVLPLEAQIRTVDKLLCVSEKESPERLPYVANFAKIFGESSNVCLSGSVVLYAVLLVDVVQFILEYVICYIVDQSFSLEGFLPEEEREVLFETGWRRCLGQTILCTSTALMMMGCVKPLLVADLLGHTGTALTHVGAVLLADQAKALLIQPIIWAVLIIRLGFAMPGIQVYNDYYMEQWDEEESLVEACQLFVQMVFETRVVTWGIIAIVSFYAMFVLLSLLLDEYLSMISWWSDAYFNVDFSILCFFVLEIILKTFAYVTDYILDIWNVVDAIIVLLSFSLSVSGLNIGGLALLRLLRLLRVVMVIRKVSANQKRLKELNKKSATGYNVGSNADRVLEIIEDLRGHKVVPRYTKADLDWMVELISSNKLYAITVEDEDTDEGMSAWMNDAVKMSTKAKDTTDEGKEKAAGDLLSKVSGIKTSQTRASGVKADGSKASSRTVSTMGGRLSTNRSNSVSQRRRSSRRRADRDLDSYEKLQIQLRERAGISDTQDKQVSLVLEKVDLWTFDIFPLSDMLEVSDVFIPVFFGRVAIYDDLVEVLCLDLELMWNWLKKMTSADVTRPNIFHGGAHTGSMIQTLYFFYAQGDGAAHGARPSADLLHGPDHHEPQASRAVEFLHGLRAASPGFALQR